MRTPFLPLRLAWHGALVLACALSVLSLLAHAETPPHPADKWEVAVEAGYLKKVRNNTPLDYTIAPLQVAWRSPAMFDLWRGDSGARLTLRHRVSVLYESYLKGAEDYYVGIAGAPSLEWWAADQKSALFFEIGGGAGFTNSNNTPGGQGQDFTFNWFSQLGGRYQFTKKQAVTAGAYFTHHSNLGMTNPNPGIDVLGLNLGMVWQLD